MSELELGLPQLRQIAGELAQRIEEGLRSDGQQIACLPAHLFLPDGFQTGRALVVDTGGTNTRAALVSLEPNDGRVEVGPNSRKVPDGREGAPLLAHEFFHAQAEMATDIPRTDPLPLGYCFSYPARSTSDGDAVLIRWTKGLRIDGAIGHKVGAPLKEALEGLGYTISDLRVLNDTVASLLGGAHLYAQPRFTQNYIGLILGTGTNMAGVFPLEQLRKVDPAEFRGYHGMVVNLESGNFHPSFLTEHDERLDGQSDNPGFHRFEKAVSGHYLPYLFNEILPGVLDPAQGTGALVELRGSSQTAHAQLADQLLRRSAHLAAAALAGLASLYPPGDTAVLGEGGLLWGDPQYADLLKATLKELAPERSIELLRQREDVNLLGAACAALTA